MTLHNIGKRIKGLKTDHQRGTEPYKLAGSNRLPTFAVDKPPVKVKITRAPTVLDTRYTPGKDVEPYFAAHWPGIDPATGKSWGKP
jgi:hypothetical protein